MTYIVKTVQMKPHEIIEWVFWNSETYYPDDNTKCMAMKISVLGLFYSHVAMADMLMMHIDRIKYYSGKASVYNSTDIDFRYFSDVIYQNIRREEKIKSAA